jgi:hypothetical protein
VLCLCVEFARDAYSDGWIGVGFFVLDFLRLTFAACMGGFGGNRGVEGDVREMLGFTFGRKGARDGCDLDCG